MQLFLLLMCVTCMFKAKTRYVFNASQALLQLVFIDTFIQNLIRSFPCRQGLSKNTFMWEKFFLTKIPDLWGCREWKCQSPHTVCQCCEEPRTFNK
jgi:hypothetical protein